MTVILVAALDRPGVALGGATVTGFESAGCSDGDCSEGSDGKKGSEAHVHVISGRVVESICWGSDWILFW